MWYKYFFMVKSDSQFYQVKFTSVFLLIYIICKEVEHSMVDFINFQRLWYIFIWDQVNLTIVATPKNSIFKMNFLIVLKYFRMTRNDEKIACE